MITRYPRETEQELGRRQDFEIGRRLQYIVDLQQEAHTLEVLNRIPGTTQEDQLQNLEEMIQITDETAELRNEIYDLQSSSVTTRSHPSLPALRPRRIHSEQRPEERSTRQTRPSREQAEHGVGIIRDDEDSSIRVAWSASLDVEEEGIADWSEGEVEESWYQGRE